MFKGHSSLHSLVHWFIDSSTHNDSSIHWFTASLLILWLIYSLRQSLIHWFIVNHLCFDSLIHLFTESSIHCFIDSLYNHFIDSLVHWSIDSLVHWVIDALVYWIIDTLIHWLVGSLRHCFAVSIISDSSIHWFINSVVHRFFHVISLASQPPFAHSVMHLTTSTIQNTFLQAIDFLYSCPMFKTSTQARAGRYTWSIILWVVWT